MPERRDPRSIIDAAEQAAAADDYAAAEELLREAALEQEARLGPLHPDLANTLNNLGIVCEINNHPDDAERCFRRAVTIATTLLKPDHPFVVTSRQNLRDFCVARGKPVELLLLPPATSRVEVRTAVAVDPRRESPLNQKSQHAQPSEPRRSVRPLAMNALGPGIMLGMILAATLPWPLPSRVEGVGSAERVELPAIAAALHQETAKASASAPDAVSTSAMTKATSTPASPTVIKAQLCATLDEWLCEPEDRPVPPGTLFFYTQVKSASATTIEHRWYRDNRLMLSVELPILASPGIGYRSFSRYTMNSESAGSWRVELRTRDGLLLHEERFSVQ